MPWLRRLTLGTCRLTAAVCPPIRYNELDGRKVQKLRNRTREPNSEIYTSFNMYKPALGACSQPSSYGTLTNVSAIRSAPRYCLPRRPVVQTLAFRRRPPALLRYQFSVDSSAQFALHVLDCTSVVGGSYGLAGVCVLVVYSHPRIKTVYHDLALTSGPRFSHHTSSAAELINVGHGRLQGAEPGSFLVAERAERVDSADNMDAAFRHWHTPYRDSRSSVTYCTLAWTSCLPIYPRRSSSTTPTAEVPFRRLGSDHVPGRLGCFRPGSGLAHGISLMVLGAVVVHSCAASTDCRFFRTSTMTRAVSHESLKSLTVIDNSFNRRTTLLFNSVGHTHIYYDDVSRFSRCLPQLVCMEVVAWHPSICHVSGQGKTMT